MSNIKADSAADSTIVEEMRWPNGCPNNLLFIILAHWKIILATLAMSFVASLICFSKVDRVYTGEAQFYFEELERPNQNFYLFRQLKLVSADAVIEHFLKGQQDGKFKNTREFKSYLKENLRVIAGKKDGVVTISVRSDDPDKAAEISNGLLDAYMEYRQKSRTEYLKKKINTLIEEKNNEEKKIIEAIKDIGGSIDLLDGNAGFSRLFSNHHRTLEYHYTLLADAVVETLKAKTTYEAILSSGNLESIRPILSKELIIKNFDDSKLSNSDISAIQNFYKMRLEIAKTTEDGLLKLTNEKCEVIKKLNMEKTLISDSLQSYCTINKQIVDAKLEIKKLPFEIAVLNYAHAPATASWPNKQNFILFFLCCGFLSGCILAVIFNHSVSHAN